MKNNLGKVNPKVDMVKRLLPHQSCVYIRYSIEINNLESEEGGLDSRGST